MPLIKRLLSVALLAMAFVLYGCGSTAVSVAAHKARPTALPTVAPARPSPVATPAIALPARLLIASIGVSAPVEKVGIGANGDMDTPRQNPWTDVGWYAPGLRPGERGSAVIDGHLDRPGGYPAIFWNLHNVHSGDIVMVQMTDGKKLSFRVTQIASYPPNKAPLQQIFGDAGGSYLNLITCAGDWVPSEHQTTLRLVVYTTLVQ